MMRLTRPALLLLATLPPAVIAACSEDSAPTEEVADGGASADGSRDAGTTNEPSDGGTTNEPTDASDGGLADASVPACTATPCIIDVGAGSGHVCALSNSGAVWCWGENFYGQGGGTDASAQSSPVLVSGLGTVKQLAVGWYHNCALLTDDSVWCWGHNRFAQLARPTDGLDEGTKTPVQVTGFPSTVVELAAGGYYTCARMQNGQVACWGQNNAGQTGISDGGTLTSSSYIEQPTVVPAISGVTAIGTTNRVTCVNQDGGLACWGSNVLGQLGDDTNVPFSPHPNPATVVGLAGPVAEIGKGHDRSVLIRLADGTVQVWGDNGAHIAGFADAGAVVPKATTIPSLTAVQIAASGSNSCVLRSSGDAWCWGRNARGANGLSPDAGTFQDTPIAVPGTSNAKHVTVGWTQFGCVLVQGGSLRCWGDNTSGQLGRGDDAGAPFDPTPQAVTF